MRQVKSFQIRGISEPVHRVDFGGRIVDYWTPSEPTNHLLISHDGQNVFDPKTSTHHQTMRMAQSAIRVSKVLGIVPPMIIAVFHSESPSNPWGRLLDLAPQDPFQNGVKRPQASHPVAPADLKGNIYLEQITNTIVPTLADHLHTDLAKARKAIIGSSMGGLASIYAIGKRPDFFSSCLALSTHWAAGNEPLVDALIDAMPTPGKHLVWMSHGTRGIDREYGPLQEYADQKMREAGWRDGHDFVTKVYKKSGHNERSWSKYLDQPMKFWLGSEPRPASN